jgi:hypothetical protein
MRLRNVLEPVLPPSALAAGPAGGRDDAGVLLARDQLAGYQSERRMRGSMRIAQV